MSLRDGPAGPSPAAQTLPFPKQASGKALLTRAPAARCPPPARGAHLDPCRGPALFTLLSTQNEFEMQWVCQNPFLT